MRFENCEFLRLQATGTNNPNCGYGIYSRGAGRITLVGCTFASNAVPLAAESWFAGYNAYGSAIFVNGTDTAQNYSASFKARGCRFVGNRNNYVHNYWYIAAYGTVVLIGNLVDVGFSNCLFLGNEDTAKQGTSQFPYEKSLGNQQQKYGGALCVIARAVATTVAVERCTFAYNIASAKDGAAGLNLISGVGSVSDSIFYGNVVGSASEGVFGADIHVGESGSLFVSNTLFAAEAKGDAFANYVNVAAGGSLVLDSRSIVYGDPCFVTGCGTFLSHLTTGGSGDCVVPVSPQSVWFAQATSDGIYDFDVHLVSRGGYFTNDGVWHETGSRTSTAILAGGANLGCYGGTQWESKPPPTGFLVILK